MRRHAAGLVVAALVLGATVPAAAHAASAPARPTEPDPNKWWTRGEPSPPEVKEPLYGRRAGHDEIARSPQISSNADPLLYRLWGLQPLQIQVVRADELILELWMRPQDSVRQAVIRITLLGDGSGVLQARAGLGCCAPEIARRIDIDRSLEPGWAAALRKLADDPAWRQPENVTVDEGVPGMLEGLCLGGTSYDLVLVRPGRAAHLRRACSGPEAGSVADILSGMIGSALGRDTRFDVLFPRGADFTADKGAYEALIKSGGGLKPAKKRG